MGLNFSALEIGRQALRASQLGLNITSQNIANVNTPEYSRQTVQLAARDQYGAKLQLTGGGVEVESVRSIRDQFVEARLLKENAAAGRWTAQRDALQPLDAVLNDSSNKGGIPSSLAEFFGAFRDLEAHPNSASLRHVAVEKGQALTNAFQSTSARLKEIRQDADGSLRSTVAEANELSEKIAKLNASILKAENTESTAASLYDQRDAAVQHLAELTGARTTTDSRNQVTVTLGDGQALVIADKSFALEIQPTAPEGLSELTINGDPAVFADGQLRGLQNAIAATGSYLTDLDDLAASVADRVNSLHSSGVDLNGDAGTPFFAAPIGGTVTAASFKVSDEIIADPKKVVVAAVGSGTGDATIARELSALLTAPDSVAGSNQGSFAELYAGIVRDAGGAIQTADDALTTQQAILLQVQAQEAAISGVSLDEEAINLLQYQRAFEAAARFLKIADEMTQTIISLAQ
jgi:flagellar hook-associated protein 1 FlgK